MPDYNQALLDLQRQFAAERKRAEAAEATARELAPLVRRLANSGCWYIGREPPTTPCCCGPCEAYRVLAALSAEGE